MDQSDDDEGLWDELNHQQSREIERHQTLRNQASRGAPWLPPVVGSAIRQTAQAVVLGITGNPDTTNQPLQNHRYESLASLMPPQSEDIDNDLGVNLFGSRQQKQQQREEPLLSGNNLYGSRFQEHHPPPAAPSHPNDNNSQNNYVFLQPFRLLPQRDGWGAVADLDVFFNSLYQYYYHRGFTTLAMKGLVEIITLFFTLGLSIFLFACLDWPALASCTEESTCHATFSSYIISSPLNQPNTSFAWKCWVFLYGLIFAAYGVFSTWSWWQALQQARASKWFMEEQLGIGERKLQSGAVDWDRDIVCKIQQLQISGQYRIAIHGDADNLDALLIAQRILRKENFMVALFNNPTLLDFSVPFFPGAVVFSKSLEWTIYFCILNFMFNHKYQLRPAFYLDPMSLKRRFFLCGIAHAIFMPFLLFFMTLYFSLQNAYDWKSTKNYLGPREWALAAKWTLRELNELPHLFEQRMEPSYDAAEKYLKLFRQNEVITAIGRVMVFTGGSLGAVLFAFAAMNDAILLHVKIADWNLLWYGGVVAAIYSAGKAMLPSYEKENPNRTYHANLSQEMDMALEQVAKHTHHYPDVWKGRGWDKTTTYKAFTRMYQYKAKLFVQELASIVVAPLLLCVSLPRCAERICDFILAIRAEVAGAGDMCGYSTFDFETFGDELWEGKTLGRSVDGLQSHLSPAARRQQNLPPMVTGSLTESIMQSGNVMESTQQFPIPRAREGKMEKSFFSFKAAHPSWKCNRSGQDLVDRLDEYQKEESAALARERELYIEAAARQLETLAQIERQQEQNGRHGGVVVDTNAMIDSYIPTSNQTAADAGAGSELQSARQHQTLAPVQEHHVTHAMPAHHQTQQTGVQQQSPARVLGQTGSMGTNDQHQQAHQEEHPSLPFASPTRPQSGLVSRTNRHSAAGTANNLAPPPSSFPPPPPGPHAMAPAPTNASASIRTTATAAAGPAMESLALSSELRRILNMSTLDPDVGSVLGDSSVPQFANAVNLARSMSGLPPVEEGRNRAAERQYLVLERFHAHNMATSQNQPPRQGEHEQAWPAMQQPQQQHPMSMSLAEGALRANSMRAHANGMAPLRRTGNDRLGDSSVL